MTEIHLPDNRELVARALRNAKPSKRGSVVRWAAVADTFALGSTYATELCKRHDLDPDEIVCKWMDDDPDEI